MITRWSLSTPLDLRVPFSFECPPEDRFEEARILAPDPERADKPGNGIKAVSFDEVAMENGRVELPLLHFQADFETRPDLARKDSWDPDEEDPTPLLQRWEFDVTQAIYDRCFGGQDAHVIFAMQPRATATPVDWFKDPESPRGWRVDAVFGMCSGFHPKKYLPVSLLPAAERGIKCPKCERPLELMVIDEDQHTVVVERLVKDASPFSGRLTATSGMQIELRCVNPDCTAHETLLRALL